MHFEQRGDDILVGPARIAPWVEPNDIRCPKCDMDSRAITVGYCPGATDPKHVELLCFGNAAEHLHVQCGRCHFCWLSETKAQRNEKPEASLARSGVVPATAADVPPMRHVSDVMRNNSTFFPPVKES